MPFTSVFLTFCPFHLLTFPTSDLHLLYPCLSLLISDSSPLISSFPFPLFCPSASTLKGTKFPILKPHTAEGLASRPLSSFLYPLLAWQKNLEKMGNEQFFLIYSVGYGTFIFTIDGCWILIIKKIAFSSRLLALLKFSSQ